MARILGVSGGAYYKWARHGLSERKQEADAELVRLIRETADRHHRRYGIPRIREELRRVYGKRVILRKGWEGAKRTPQPAAGG